MTIEEMKEKKRELGYSYEQIAELAHLPLSTVQKVLGGITRSPRYDTLSALETVFEPKRADRIQETQPAYYVEDKVQGEYTIRDYFDLPDERRVELIDGVIYDMGSPTVLHQMLADEICSAFKNYIRRKKGNCISIMSPVDVQLDCDDKTIVQPDVVVLCDRSKIKDGRIFGAPDLLVEVLSPATKKKDMHIKLAKYIAAGVREYWIVNPKDKTVVVYDNQEDDMDIRFYTFEHEIPVDIYGGDCIVNFREIYAYVAFLYQM